jgi:hypothetical protein
MGPLKMFDIPFSKGEGVGILEYVATLARAVKRAKFSFILLTKK